MTERSADENASQVILTFLDENRNEWLASALVGPLVSRDGNMLQLEALKDRAFFLKSFRIVHK